MTNERDNSKQPAPANPAAMTDIFVGGVLGMSWQLAVVVVVPIVAGNIVDRYLGSLPWLTLAGLAIALLGTVGIMWRTVREANTRVVSAGQQKDKK